MSFWFHCLDKILPWNFLYLPGGFLEAFWGFLQAYLFMILHTKSPGSPKSFHEAPRKLQKKTQGRNPDIISLVFLSKRWNQKDILELTDCYLAGLDRNQVTSQVGLPKRPKNQFEPFPQSRQQVPVAYLALVLIYYCHCHLAPAIFGQSIILDILRNYLVFLLFFTPKPPAVNKLMVIQMQRVLW